MSYKVPFFAVQSALYSALSGSDIGINWFDAGVSTEEIADFYKDQGEYAYGIIGASDADANANKDAVVWTMNLDLEVYSNYKGRKAVTNTLESLLNFFADSGTWDEMNTNLEPDGFMLVSVTVSRLRVNLPVYGDTGVWQSGATTVRLLVSQKE